MIKINEYKGEKAIAQLTARLVPPNDNYPDCMCELVLTKGHLYILEDNFNGTLTEHFIFPISQIENIQIQKEKRRLENNNKASQNALGVIGLLFGVAIVPSGGNVQCAEFLHITYKNGMGGLDTIFFEDFETSAKSLERAFGKVKKALQ